MALRPAVIVFVGGMVLALVVWVPMRRDLRSLGRQFGISGRMAWLGYTLAVAGVASVSVLGGTLPENSFLTVGLWVLYVPGWVGLVYAASTRRLHRRLRHAPTPETGAVAPTSGPVAVSGEVAAVDEPATTPLLGEPAVCHTWTVEQHRRFPRPNWTTVALGQGGVPFLLDDGSGAVQVDPTDAELRLVAVGTRQVDAEESPPPETVAFLEAVGVDPTDTTHQYTERRLREGETAYVLGVPRSPSPGRHPDATVAIDGGEPLVVGTGAVGAVTRRLGRTRRVAAAGGALGVALGYGGMVLAGGVVPL